MRLSVFLAALILLCSPCFAQEITIGERKFIIPPPPKAELFQQATSSLDVVSSFVIFDNNRKSAIADVETVLIRKDVSCDGRKEILNNLKRLYDEIHVNNPNATTYDVQVNEYPIPTILMQVLITENSGSRTFIASLGFFVEDIEVHISLTDNYPPWDAEQLNKRKAFSLDFLFDWGAEITIANESKHPSGIPLPKTTPSEKIASTGTGFFISPNGVVVTNYHVIENATEIAVKDTFTGEITKAQVIKEDPTNDIAILKIKESDHPYLSFYSGSTPRKGEDIISLGYPLVSLQGQEQKATFGKINAQSGADGDIRFFQVDAPIQPGNSGGPLLNSHGEVIGINTQTANAAFMLVEKGILPQNINYAIKIDYAIPAARDALAEYDMKIPVGSGSTYSSVADVVAATEKAVALIIVK